MCQKTAISSYGIDVARTLNAGSMTDRMRGNKMEGVNTNQRRPVDTRRLHRKSKFKNKLFLVIFVTF